ncbi:alpha-2-macroglobulin [Treponema sp.]|uniref:alpha-2-macroglobulin n=1 Tax=Treponema sp. TaxID=166 RepID=UPI00388CF9C2
MKKNVVFISVLLSIFAFVTFSCKEKTEKVFVEYGVYKPSVAYNADGAIDTLYVEFGGSVSRLDLTDKEIPDDGEEGSLIEISPAIPGKWRWSSDSALVFKPEERWQLGTTYKVKMNQKIFSDNVRVNNDFSFKTDGFEITLSDIEFYINPENPSEKRVTASFSASHPIEKEGFEKFISMEMKVVGEKGSSSTKKVDYTVSWSKDSREVYLVSDLIPIPPKTSTFTVKRSSGIKTTFGGTDKMSGSYPVEIPGMTDYVKINEISHSLIKNEAQNYDQIISVETKGQVSGEELLSHMEVFVLPKDKPEEQGFQEQKNYDWEWSEKDVFTDLVKSQSKKIEAELIPTAENAVTLNNFIIKAPESSYIFVRFTGTISFLGGYKLSCLDDYPYAFIQVKSYPVELGILSEGTILSLSGSRKMALSSRGVSKVRYTLSRIMPKDVNHLVSMSNGDMKNFRFDSYSFDEDNISEKEYAVYNVPGWSKEKVSYFSFDFSSHLTPNPGKNLSNGLFLFEVEDYSNNRADYYSKKDKRLILVTDLGFIVKRNPDGTKDVFVQSISSGNPVSNAQVQIVGLNGNAIVSTYTDSTGHANLPKTTSDVYRDEHAPTAYIVKTSGDLSFMPYSERGRSLDYSNYNIGGEYGSDNPAKINAYMFSDRGMYRPGDTVHIGLIAKSGDWNKNLKNLPLECEVRDSKNSVLYTNQFQLSAAGFEEITFATKDYSPTGVYDVNLYILRERNGKTERDFLSSTSVKIEEFQPDTLKISTTFEPIPNGGWINPQVLKGNVNLKNLFGTPASKNDVKAQMNLYPGFPVLRKYSDYYFSDPFSKTNSYEQFLGTQQTDENGDASFELDVNKFEKATYRLEFYAEGFEKESGRSVSQMASLYVSPLKYLIGYKSDGSLSYINKNTKRKLSFIAIDQNLNKIDLNDVTVKIEEIKYISTLVKQPNGLFKYQSVKKAYPLSSQIVSISKNGTDFFVPSETAGEFKITLVDSEGLVFNTINCTVIGEENSSRSLTRTAELELKLEKSDLAGGETAKIFIKAPYAGFGLITVERDKVYSWKWFKTNELSSVQTIQIPQNIEGNAYINVMFTRNPSSDEIFMSPFCYGAVPFTLDKSGRTNRISLDFKDEIKSGEDLTINYSSSDEGKIVIFAVDEGILQVAKYKTPDPLSFFFKKRALEVSTSQILDLILPEFEVLKTMSATGGGASMDALSRNLNPFKRKQNAPVAYWSGIIETGKEKRSVTYHVPDYFNGTLRIMAVAVSNGTVGASQSSAVAANTFVISPNAPLAVSPSDEFDVSVTVTNNHKGSGTKNKITLKAEVSSNLEILNEKSAALVIDEGKDETVSFKLRAKNELGGAEIKFTASDSSENSSLSSTLSVRPSMPYQIWIKSGRTEKQEISTDVKRNLYSEFAERKASVSNAPAGFIDGLDFYLEKYPYGCSEQVTSKAYPYLYEDFVKAGHKTHADAQKMVSDTLSILQSRMLSDGNIGYWTNKSKAQSEITLYCAEFLTDAKKHGFFVPQTFFNRVMEAVKSIADSSKDDSFSILQRSYAIYILTKNEIVTTNYIEKLEGDLNRRNYTATEYEGLYLAASYAMLKQDKKANAILGKINRKKTFDSSWIFHNGLHYVSTYIEIIACYFPERISDIKANQIDYLCEHLESAYYNTYSVSAAIRAFESYSSVEKAGIYEIYEINGKEETSLSLEGTAVLKGKFSPKAEKLSFRTDKKMPLFYQTVIAGFETEIPSKEIKEGLEISREFTNLDGKKIISVKTGDDILVKISYRSQKGRVYNVAVVDMLCAGLEADIESIRTNKYNKNPSADYVDIREDRVVIYTTVTDKVTTFTYKAKAASSGKFTVPPLFAESMYNKDIRALKPQEAVTIEKMN